MERVQNKTTASCKRFTALLIVATCCAHAARTHASQNTLQETILAEQRAIEAEIRARNERTGRRASNIQQWHQTVAPQREAELAEQAEQLREFAAKADENHRAMDAQRRQAVAAAKARLAQAKLEQAQQREIVAQAAAPASANPEIPSYSGKPVVSRIRLRFVPPGSPESSYWPALAPAPVLEDQPVGPELPQS